jgi:hypothetical protein
VSKPIVYAHKPVSINLEAGEEYHFCACGHSHLSQFSTEDLGTWHAEMAQLSGVSYVGVSGPDNPEI